MIIKLFKYYPFYKGRGWFVFQKAIQKHLKSLPSEFAVPLYDDQYIYVNPRDYIGSMVYLFRDLDPNISWCLKNILREGDLFVDVGSHFGTETIPDSKLVGQKGEVHAFEPNPKCFILLNRSLRENKITNVQLHQCAITDFVGTINLHIPINNTGSASVSNNKSFSSQEVKASTLDSYKDLKKIKIKLLKIDVEGHEYSVLKGAEDTFRINKPENILIEVWPTKEVPFSSLEVTRFLTKHGYTAYQLVRRFSLFPSLRKIENSTINKHSSDFLFTLK